MAAEYKVQAADYQYIQTKEFPKQHEKTFNTINSGCYAQKYDEKILNNNGKDRRSKQDIDFYKLCIGQLRMNFNGDYFVGTGTVIEIDEKSKICYVLTCAHNVVEVDVIGKKKVFAKNVWFDLKKGSNNKPHELLKRFKINKIYVHPQYFNHPNSYSGYDIAICSFVFNDKQWYKEWIDYVKHTLFVDVNQKNFNKDWTDISYFDICGYPGERHGELWGMWAAHDQIPNIEIHEKVIRYKCVDTTGGQSGSPIFVGFGDYGDYSPKPIIGVHSGGSKAQKSNWATKITLDTVKWIASVLKQPYGKGPVEAMAVYDFHKFMQ